MKGPDVHIAKYALFIFYDAIPFIYSEKYQRILFLVSEVYEMYNLK